MICRRCDEIDHEENLDVCPACTRELEESLREACRRLDGAIAENATLHERCEALEVELADVRVDYLAANGRLRKRNERLQAVATREEAQGMLIATLRAERDELRQKCIWLEGVETERDELRERCEALEGENKQWGVKWSAAVETGGNNTGRVMKERDAALEELADCKALLGEIERCRTGETGFDDSCIASKYTVYRVPTDLAARVRAVLSEVSLRGHSLSATIRSCGS